jgi:hypothetical protein
LEALSVLAPNMEALEHEQVAVVALPFGAVSALLGSGLVAEIDWQTCGQLSRILARGVVSEVDCLVPAAAWTSVELLLLYSDTNYGRVCHALSQLGRRDLAILPKQTDDDTIDALIKLAASMQEPQRLHVLAGERDAARFRLRAGRRGDA